MRSLRSVPGREAGIFPVGHVSFHGIRLVWEPQTARYTRQTITRVFTSRSGHKDDGTIFRMNAKSDIPEMRVVVVETQCFTLNPCR
jgi:hypothetical protein